MIEEFLRGRRVTIEEVAKAPEGTVIFTADGFRAFHKYGPGKMDWEWIIPSGSGQIHAISDNRGSRTFRFITKLLHAEPLFRLER